MMNSQTAFMDNLKQLFAECDLDQSGSLGRDEFKELCKRIGLNMEAVEETFKRLDTDKNEQITFDEFMAGFQQYSRRSAATVAAATATDQPLIPATPTGRTRPAPPARLQASARTRAHALPGLCTPSTSSSSGNSFSGVVSGVQPQQQASCTSTPSSATNSPNFDQSSSVVGDHRRTQEEVILYSGGELINDQVAAAHANNSGQFGSLLSNSSSVNCSQVKTMQDLLECVQKLQNENQILTQIFFKDKREREEYISQLGEEFDQQLKELEERAQLRAKQELEAEKKRLREMMQAEREELEQHYQTLEKVSKLVESSSASGAAAALLNGVTNGGACAGSEHSSIAKVKSQLEDTFMENRQLKRSLLDTKTDVAMIWKEMEKLKKQYEDKLSNAYEKHRETKSECDHIKQQLNLMKDSNRRLQDASDVITNYITDRVEPVIKVASGCNLSECEESHEHIINGTLRCNSASNSRRGSILSEYLDNNDLDKGESLEETKATLNSLRVPTSGGDLLQQQNRNNKSQPESQIKANEQAAASINDSPDVSANSKAMVGSKKQSKQRDESQKSSSAIKNLGRNLFLGAAQRANSDGASQQLGGKGKKLIDSQHFSADNSPEEPIVEPADGPSKATFNIILVGDSFVGKSSFAARFIEGSFVQGLISNCSIDFKTKSYKVDGLNYTVNLWDTAGQERFRSITASYFRKADGIILMYDVTDKRSYLNVRNWMSTISDTAAENVAVLLVGNKIDLRHNENKAKCVPTEEGFRLAKEYDIVFLETSVKTGTNLLPSMGSLIRLIAKNANVMEEDKDRIRLGDKSRTFNCMPKNC